MTCKRNKKYMPHVLKGFTCVEVKYVNTKKTCHLEKVFMCFSMEHVNTKKTCYMSEWCFCVFAKHVFLSHGICVYGKHVLTNERHKQTPKTHMPSLNLTKHICHGSNRCSCGFLYITHPRKIHGTCVVINHMPP